jgi:tetratricopeptide (TPR) repeat protein
MGLLEEAERHQRRAAEVLAREGDRYNAHMVRADHASSLAAMGRMSEAMAVYRELRPFAQGEGLSRMESALQVNLGEILMRTGDLDAARVAFEAALVTTRETGARWSRATHSRAWAWRPHGRATWPRRGPGWRRPCACAAASTTGRR